MRTRGAILAACLVVGQGVVFAQTDWTDAGLPNRCVGINEIYTDTVNDALYCAGYIQHGPTNDWSRQTLARYDANGWSQLGLFGNVLLTSVVYHDTLFAGGVFTTVDSLPIAHLAAYYDGGWHAVGNFSRGVRQLEVFDDELYAFGSFDTVDGQQANGVAKRIGNSWTVLDPLPPSANNTPLIYCAEMYNGELYIGGSFTIGSSSDLVKYNGTSWSSVGGSIQGGISWVNQLEVFNGELYAGGLFSMQSGNAGGAIMRWNGSSWNSLGSGIQDTNGNYHTNMQVYALKVHQGKLYVGGWQSFAGDIPSECISTWDGDQWCNVGTSSFDGYSVRAIEFFRDTLFISSGYTINGDSINFLTKWTGGAFADTCSIPMAIGELSFPALAVSVRPNPFSDQAQLVFSEALTAEHTVELMDLTGRIVRRIRGNGDRELLLVRDGLANGVYQVLVSDDYSVVYNARVVVE
jgi:hypothetical protein